MDGDGEGSMYGLTRSLLARSLPYTDHHGAGMKERGEAGIIGGNEEKRWVASEKGERGRKVCGGRCEGEDM